MSEDPRPRKGSRASETIVVHVKNPALPEGRAAQHPDSTFRTELQETQEPCAVARGRGLRAAEAEDEDEKREGRRRGEKERERERKTSNLRERKKSDSSSLQILFVPVFFAY